MRLLWRVLGAAVAVVAFGGGALLARHLLVESAEGPERLDARVLKRAASRIVVDLDGGSLALGPGSAGRIELDRRYRPPRAVEVTTSWAGDVLTVTGRCPSGSRCGSSLAVRLPPETPVEVRTVSADVTATALTGPLTLTTRTGDLRLDGLTGELAVTTNSGTIAGTGLGPSRLTLHSNSGPAELSFAAPPEALTAESNSGDLDLVLPPGVYRVAAESATGERTSTLREGATGPAVTVRSSSGDVRLR